MLEFKVGATGGSPNPPKSNPDAEVDEQLRAKPADPQVPDSTFVPNDTTGISQELQNTSLFNNLKKTTTKGQKGQVSLQNLKNTNLNLEELCKLYNVSPEKLLEIMQKSPKNKAEYNKMVNQK